MNTILPMHKPTVTIGIPAYNEEANIRHLLASVLEQRRDSFELLEVVVVSDGSKDRTVEIASSFAEPRIKVIDRKNNIGLAGTQNEICQLASGDILVMFDADVLLEGNNFINKIIEPIIKNDAGLVGADTVSMPGRNLFEKIIADSHKFKQNVYRRINGGNNIYLCHGRARAFSRELYNAIKWPIPQHGEDAYSYLFAVSNGFKFVYQPSARVIFRSPSSWRDHSLQSQRFLNGQKILEESFGINSVRKSYKIPKSVLVKTALECLFKMPLSMISYIVLHLYIRFLIPWGKKDYTKWEASGTSKKVI